MKTSSLDGDRRLNIAYKFLLAGLVRIGLIYSDYRQLIADRVEVSTLLNSWRRVTEGVYLYERGINPYDGDIFHETPVGLVAFSWLLRHLPHLLGLIFVLTDMLTAYALYSTAALYVREMAEKEKAEKEKYARDVSQLLLPKEYFQEAPKYVLMLYLFNPYNIFNCVGFTTTTFGNLCLALTFLFMMKGYRLLCCLCLGLSVLQSFYSLVLLVPVCLCLARHSPARKLLSVTATLTVFLVVISGLLALSYHIIGDWKFLQSVYVLILTVTDLRPNIGLFWYFFTEMFEHFRLLFIFSFQLNATALYLPPLSLRFHRDPLLLGLCLTSLAAVFKSYPCLGDVGFYLALLPMWKHLFHRMQQGFIILCSLIVTSVLGPTVWYLWIYSRSANANFYFGVTLAFATAQIFLITDLLFAYIKREFALKEGFDSEEKIDLKLTLD